MDQYLKCLVERGVTIDDVLKNRMVGLVWNVIQKYPEYCKKFRISEKFYTQDNPLSEILPYLNYDQKLMFCKFYLIKKTRETTQYMLKHERMLMYETFEQFKNMSEKNKFILTGISDGLLPEIVEHLWTLSFPPDSPDHHELLLTSCNP